MTVPDATAGDGLRSAVIALYATARYNEQSPREFADELMALPAFVDVQAAAAVDAEKVQRLAAVRAEFMRRANERDEDDAQAGGWRDVLDALDGITPEPEPEGDMKAGTEPGHEHCPDCGDDPNDHTLHAAGCRRILPAGDPRGYLQDGPPWLPWVDA
jgi:hypothetical protein